MNIKIISKRTGLGNQIKFIPHIRELQKRHHVYTDSDVYPQLGIIEVDNTTVPDVCYLVYNYKRNLVIRERMKYPKAKMFGYVGAKSKIAKLLLNGYKQMDHNNTEIWNNSQFVPTDEKLHIDGWKPIKDKIALINSNKWNKHYAKWGMLSSIFLLKGYDISYFGDIIKLPRYIYTHNLKELKEELCKCRYYIGTDSGSTQLSAALGLPGLTIWGDSKLRGIPVNTNIIMGLSTNPGKIFREFKNHVEGR